MPRSKPGGPTDGDGFRSPIAKWEVIAASLRKAINAGEYVLDQPLPSEVTLMQEYEVSRETVRRAVAELRKEGLVYTIPQRGTFVGKVRPVVE